MCSKDLRASFLSAETKFHAGQNARITIKYLTTNISCYELYYIDLGVLIILIFQKSIFNEFVNYRY